MDERLEFDRGLLKTLGEEWHMREGNEVYAGFRLIAPFDDLVTELSEDYFTIITQKLKQITPVVNKVYSRNLKELAEGYQGGERWKLEPKLLPLIEKELT